MIPRLTEYHNQKTINHLKPDLYFIFPGSEIKKKSYILL